MDSFHISALQQFSYFMRILFVFNIYYSE